MYVVYITDCSQTDRITSRGATTSPKPATTAGSVVVHEHVQDGGGRQGPARLLATCNIPGSSGAGGGYGCVSI